ncbi:NAD(P)/FAD-dependent oxidoreductase [Flavobacterium sp. NKUCC04_CG]|uniref:NAD(P)/FAD-dependent oxidoreductase n=1 Tax=Flavobacterium sp. NKUCC04_CG TaxID=2842121 RepID=UPI001C5B93B8|nr:NAD(P)/FAD-dependent oxidoreductase [Flavobacterium sp. NKUCC04_CG]MBW3518622.1 NAD(P)/FAD-dependent oxidoreductase [Flavobacterium sp. NKUCC04_CG]
MKTNPKVIIIGGGLAGLVAAIHLSNSGLSVMLIEKSAYPRHKVCGEYVSNEICSYLEELGVDVQYLKPTSITQLEFSNRQGKLVNASLPLGGFGISRYALDYYLYQKALENGCTIIQALVTAVDFSDELFDVTTPDQVFRSKMVLGAYGKRSNLDLALKRDFIHKTAAWLAVKAHYSSDFPNNLVALHNFKGGYCGVSKVENNSVNICYLADYKTFKKYKNIADYQREVLYTNKHLKAVLENSTPLFEKPLTISQISFDKKPTIEKHILMIGDTAGLIHPLCGNGMAMAIHAAKIASELVLDFYNGKIASRKLLEQSYAAQWENHFGKRLFMGRILAKALQYESLTNILFHFATTIPSLLPWIIKQTHGKPIAIS